MKNNLYALLFVGVCVVGEFKIEAKESEEVYQKGLASLYDFKGDKYSGQHVYACERRLKLKVSVGVWKDMLDKGVAHRRLPCGTKLKICTESSIMKKSPICTTVYVIDRGPYGALNKKNEWFVRAKLNSGERWRGIMDLRPPVAKRLAFNGLERIRVFRHFEEDK